MATKSNQTFRPYLTAAEITHIIAQQDAMIEPTKVSTELKKKLSVYLFKIQSDLASPSYIYTPKQSLSEKLGFTLEDLESNSLAPQEQYEFLCNLENPTEEQIAKGRELEIQLFGQVVGGI
jgi:hypothetical protein